MRRALYILTSPIWVPVAAVLMGFYYFGFVGPLYIVGLVQKLVTDQTHILDWLEEVCL